MLNIAICDDDKQICEFISLNVKKYFERSNMEVWVERFTSGESLMESLNNVVYDIVLLDIDLVTSTGIQVGSYIREELHNDVVQIIYISSNTQYAMALFDTRPLNFLTKPVDEYKLCSVLTKAIDLINAGAFSFVFTIGHDEYHIDIKNIIYFVCNNRIISLYMDNGKKYEFYGKLKDIYEKLKSYKFFYAHKSYLVSYDKVKIFKFNELIMTDDSHIEISQSKRKEVRQLTLKYEDMTNDEECV